jgi:RAQPRD family integrative conjugative element protein
MESISRHIRAWRSEMAVPSLALALSLASLHPAHAADDAPEREQLAALVRQIELADRLADHLAEQAVAAPQERARYHFDYVRLRADLQRVRTGLQDYLVPQRAQPRDPVPMSGDYVRRDERPEVSR